MPRFSLTVLAAFALLITRPASAQVQYTVTTLAALGGKFNSPWGINDSGQVVGGADLNTGYTHAYLYANNAMQDLGTLGGLDSQAYAINSSGQVVGISATGVSPGNSVGFVYSGGAMTALGSFGGSLGSEATAINASGQVVGSAYTAGNQEVHGFLYSNGTMTDLGTLLGGTQCYPWGINDSGQVVGYAYNTRNVDHAFLYSNGTATDLGTFGGLASGATAINSAGQVVGSADLANNYDHAFLFSNGHMTDLGAIGGVNGTSWANAINDIGQIVGVSNHGTDGMLWQNGGMYDLNSLLVSDDAGWTIHEATAINDNGWIVGYGINPNVNGGQTEGLLLIPTPEPASLVIVGLGAVGLLMASRRIIARRR